MAITATPGLATPRMETIQRAAAGLPSNVFNTLVQVAGATPALTTPRTSGATPGQFGSYVGGYQVCSFVLLIGATGWVLRYMGVTC